MTDIVTPVGRLVQGDCFEPQTKDAEGNPLTFKTGPNAGQPRKQWFIAVAVPKTDPQVNQMPQAMTQVAQEAFPQGQYNAPNFAWKYLDGDGVDSRGQPHSAKEGFAGCWVFRFASGFPPRCFHTGKYQPHEQIQDPQAIKRGYYVRVAASIAGNDSLQQPGLYLNFSMVELVGYGEEIVSGPDPSQLFGAAPAPTLPAGASSTPLPASNAPAAGTAPPAGGPAAAPAQGQQPGAMPPQGGAPAQQPPQGQPAAAPAVQPDNGFGNPGGAPAQEPPRRDANGNVWTPDQLRQHGFSEDAIQQFPLA